MGHKLKFQNCNIVFLPLQILFVLETDEMQQNGSSLSFNTI